MARVMPGLSRGGVPAVPKLGTWGSSCIWRPMPWPTNCRMTEKPAFSTCFWIAEEMSQVTARLRLADADVQRFLGDLDQAVVLLADLAHADRDADIRPEAVKHQAEVEADHVAGGDPAVAGDAVHRLVVDGHADRLREAVVAQKAGDGAAVSDELVGDAVQVRSAYAWRAGVLQGRQHRREQAARAGHQIDLVLGLEVDHV